MPLDLQSERLTLTPLSLTDVELIIEMFTDAEVLKYAGGKAMSEEAVREKMPTWIRRAGNGCIGVWCVSDRVSGEKYGTCALLPMPIDEEDTDWDSLVEDAMPVQDIEVGYFLKRPAWNKGYATEACRRILRFAFTDTPLTKVVATIDDDNERSRHVLEKAGFFYQGRARAYAEDSPIFCIERDGWKNSTINRPG